MKEDSENKAIKPIAAFQFKTISTNNEPAKTKVIVWNNGITHIEQLIFSKHNDFDPDHEVVTERFGKKLRRRTIALKFTTLSTIHYNVLRSLIKSGINLKDVE